MATEVSIVALIGAGISLAANVIMARRLRRVLVKLERENGSKNGTKE